MKVPPFPPVAAKLLALLSAEDVNLGGVADLILSDATFTARILQRANSAEFGLRAEVTSIPRAVGFLGTALTRQIVLAHAAGAYAKNALRTEQLRRCWEHNAATAALAEEIAHSCRAFESTAFTAGIIHDIGRLGLMVAFPGVYEKLIRHAAERCIDLLDFEQEEFGLDHAAAGRLLAERWGLPTDLAVIAGRHHDPCEGAELDLLRIVHVACRLADHLGYFVVQPLVPPKLEDILAELPPGARERIAALAPELAGRVAERIQELDPGAAEAPAHTGGLALRRI